MMLRAAGGHKYGAQSMVEDQFAACDWGDEWKRSHGNDHPVHPAKVSGYLQYLLMPNGEPEPKRDFSDDDER
eukprot:5644683-Alexandrium_andersonii.AAC.1